MKLRSIHIYPVKGLSSIELDRSFVELRGLRFDRRWMLVDEEGVFLSQRKFPAMALLKTRIDRNRLQVSREGYGEIGVALQADGPSREVTVWKSSVQAEGYSKEIDEWFRNALGFPCSLVVMPESSIRPTNPEFSKPGDHVSFADGYPITLASLESLADLNRRTEKPIPMDRFRPNMVMEGAAEPWEEETWDELEIGPRRFRMAKPCGRCLVTTIDQSTGAMDGPEPLRTLGAFRKNGPTVDFSVNLIPENEGMVAIGDEVQVLSLKSD